MASEVAQFLLSLAIGAAIPVVACLALRVSFWWEERETRQPAPVERRVVEAKTDAQVNKEFMEEATRQRDAALAKVSALEARLAVMGEALTPSGDTKAAYIGEFGWTREIPDPEWDGDDGEEPDRITERLVVPWTTIKEIMAAIRARAALSQEEERADG